MSKIDRSDGPRPKLIKPVTVGDKQTDPQVAVPKAGEKVRLSAAARDPNRTGAMIKLLAGTVQAREAAEAAKAAMARRDEADKARADAAAEFSGSVRAVRQNLNQAEAMETGLAERKAKVGEISALLDKAGQALPRLDPSSQVASADVLERLQGRHRALEERAGQEQKAVDDGKAKLTADRKSLDEALGRSGDEKALGRTLRGLAEAYADLDARVKDLPPDAAKEQRAEAESLRKVIHKGMVMHADKSSVSEPDNAYLFGRPGKAFKEHLRPVEDWLSSPAGPLPADKRRELLTHLQELDEAVADVQDPLLKQAAAEVIADVSKRAFARLSGS
ncbi:MAG: hypothetical protein VKO21_09720 [Candidatus Sericytochromatia bacterium]|nr:hypothetical protein [Candidatus Sericytochromatia bacterium]